MATRTHLEMHITAQRGEILAIGPWVFTADQAYPEFFGAEIQLPATTLVQIVGGTAPIIAAIGTVQLLSLYPDQDIRVGLQGLNAQTQGFTLNALQIFLSGRGNIASLNVYNTATSLCNLVLVIGGF